MSFEAQVRTELDALRDDRKFEDLASALLLSLFPNLSPTGGAGDEGRDAVVRRGLIGDVEITIQYSTEQSWKSKLRQELAKHAGGNDAKLPMVFVTSRRTSSASQREIQKDAEDLGFSLTIYDQRWTAVRLAGEQRNLAESYLSLTPPAPSALLPASDYTKELIALIPGFGAPLIAHSPSPRDIVSRLEMDGVRAIVLVGPGGSGKTRLALHVTSVLNLPCVVLRPPFSLTREAVAEIPPWKPAVLVIDDAHNCQDLSGVKALIQDRHWDGCAVIMTCRPGYESEVTSKAGLNPLEHQVLAVGEMTRGEIDNLLTDEPYRIGNEDLRVFIIQLADGNPLIAHMAAQSAVRGDLGRPGIAKLLDDYWQKLRPDTLTSVEATIVSALALYGPVWEADLAQLADALGYSEGQAREAIDGLADRGLLLADSESVALKPDRIASAVVSDLVMPKNGLPRVDLQMLLRSSLASQRRENIVSTLADSVFYSQGTGEEALRRFLMGGPIGAGGDRSRSEWRAALLEMHQCAHAMPRLCARVLRSFRQAWPLDDPPDPAYPLDRRSLLKDAGSVATALARVDLRRSLEELFELAAVPQARDRRRNNDESPIEALIAFLGGSYKYSPDAAIERNLEALESLEAWSHDRNDADSSGVIAEVAVSLITASFEFQGPSPESEMSYVFGSVLAPPTDDLKRLVMGSADLASRAIDTLNEDGLVRLVRGLERVDREARGLPAIGGLTPDERARTLLAKALRSVLSVLVEHWETLPVEVRHVLSELSRRNRKLAELVRSDQELAQFNTVFGMPRPQQDWRKQERQAAREVDKLARTLGCHGAVQMVVRFASAASRVDANGAMRLPRLLHQAGLQASPEEVEEAVQVMLESSEAKGWLPWLLRGALTSHGEEVEPLVLALSREADTYAIAAQLLALLSDAGRRAVLDNMPEPPPVYVIELLCRELQGLERLDAHGRALELMRVGRLVEPPDLGHVLEWFGPEGDGTMLPVPEDLRKEFIALLSTQASVLDDGHDGPNRECWLEPAFSAAVDAGLNDVLRIVDARVKAVQAAIREKGYFMESLLPKQLLGAIAGAEKNVRSQFVRALADRIPKIEGEKEGSRLVAGMCEALSQADPDSDALENLLLEWVAEGRRGRMRAIQAVSSTGPGHVFERIAKEILANHSTLDEEDALLAALHPLHTASGVFVGSLPAKYREVLGFLEPWLADSAPSIRDFAARGIEQFTELLGTAESRR